MDLVRLARDALQVLGAQIGVLPMPLDDYPQDDKTRSAHLERIRQLPRICSVRSDAALSASG
jgi:hypothetical protein